MASARSYFLAVLMVTCCVHGMLYALYVGSAVNVVTNTHPNSPSQARFHANGTLLYVVSPNQARLNANGTLLVADSPKQARLNADGKLVVDSASRNRTLLKEYHIKGDRPSVHLGLRDTTSQLGKYNWTLYSKDELQRWDREASQLMQNLQCQNHSQGTAANPAPPPHATLPLCPCVPPDLRK
jgi:hypothetical protein